MNQDLNLCDFDALITNNSEKHSKPHYRVCNYCEAMCGLEIHYVPTADTPETIFKVRPDKKDTFSKGSVCPKASALGPLLLDKSRLKYPVKKIVNETGNTDWQQISWDEAFNIVSEKLVSLRKTYGANTTAAYLGNPIVHNMGMLLFIKTFIRSLGSKNIFSATSMDQLPHHFVSHFMFGNEFRLPIPDIDRTEYMIIMGANPMASNGSIMTAAGVSKRLNAIQKRGGKFIVIDPRRTETAKQCSEHHFITPETDVYFLLSFLHVLFRDKHVHIKGVEPHIEGFDLVEPLLSRYSPAAVATVVSISEKNIERMVSEFVKADKAVLYGRMGLSTQRHGGMCHWLINLINILSGNFDKAGGLMFPSPAIELAQGKSQKKRLGRWHSRVRKLPEFSGELPVSTMADEMLTEGKDKVRALISICGNPVLSSPAGHRLDKALLGLEFMVSIDNYINETTRHADIILPTPSGLEVDHYDLVFNAFAIRNNAKFSSAMIPIEKGRLFDWQILKELSKRISSKKLSLLDRIATPKLIINLGLLFGKYGKLSSPRRLFTGLSLQKVMRAKHGIDLGPMQPRVPECLSTPNKKIHLAPTIFLNRLEELSTKEFPELIDAEASDDPTRTFKLIGRRNVNSNNSWMHQASNLNRSRHIKCTAMLHPDDAQHLGVAEDEVVKISSRVGKVLIPVEISDTVMPGVVSIPHGYGHSKSGTYIPVAEQKPGVSVNDLTDHMRIDPLTGNAAFSGLELKISKIS